MILTLQEHSEPTESALALFNTAKSENNVNVTKFFILQWI